MACSPVPHGLELGEFSAWLWGFCFVTWENRLRLGEGGQHRPLSASYRLRRGTKGARTHLTGVGPEDDDALRAGTHGTRKMLPVLSQPDPGALRTKPPAFSDGLGLLLWPDATLKNHCGAAAL